MAKFQSRPSYLYRFTASPSEYNRRDTRLKGSKPNERSSIVTATNRKSKIGFAAPHFQSYTCLEAPRGRRSQAARGAIPIFQGYASYKSFCSVLRRGKRNCVANGSAGSAVKSLRSPVALLVNRKRDNSGVDDAGSRDCPLGQSSGCIVCRQAASIQNR